MKKLCIISTVTVLLLSMASMATAQETDSPKYEIVSDIPYPNDGANQAQEQCKLDLYLPRGQKDFPVFSMVSWWIF